MPADAATGARVQDQDCQGDQGDCGGRALPFPSSADPRWNGEHRSFGPQGARARRRKGTDTGWLVVMGRWLLVNGDGDGIAARHGRLLRRRPPRPAENGQRRTDLQEAPPAWARSGQKENWPTRIWELTWRAPGVGWCGSAVLFQPCRTGRLGVSGVSSNLVVSATVLWFGFFPIDSSLTSGTIITQGWYI
jgi:hypothetical protein